MDRLPGLFLKTTLPLNLSNDCLTSCSCDEHFSINAMLAQLQMARLNELHCDRLPYRIEMNDHFEVYTRAPCVDHGDASHRTTAVTKSITSAIITRNKFNMQSITVVSSSILSDRNLQIRTRHRYTTVNNACMRPASLRTNTKIDGRYHRFTAYSAIYAILDINWNKWQALHLLVDEIGSQGKVAGSAVEYDTKDTTRTT